MKSERLKKLESELRDLDNWLKLGLVPKKDVEKHKLEIETIKAKMDEEKQRLIFLKESGDMEDYAALPKRSNQKQLYEHQSMPDIETEVEEVSEVDVEAESASFEADHSSLFDIEMGGEEKGGGGGSQEHDSDEDPYSDKSRWRRATEIGDPDSNDW